MNVDGTHVHVLVDVGDLLLHDLGLVLGQQLQDGLGVDRVTDKRMLKRVDRFEKCL